MRILQVSAHYPPDFVSGGTLIPASLARACREAGHEVRVFAGNYNGCETLEEFDAVVDGVDVHWVGNRGFASWDLEENYTNLAVAERFEAFVAGFRPHVAHFHSIHTLGAETLEVARRYGAAIVVTMHDFWWVCARQFLVDTAMKPCPFDVAGGGCDCSRTHEWLMERNAWLGQRLALADAILVPSATMLGILESNGIDMSKAILCPNGVEEMSLASRRPENRDGVRFMYAGGPSPYKGFEALREACAMLAPPEGVTLDLYGAPADGFPAWVRENPAYSRSEAPEAFAAHDVLVLPSVARESFSILAREALAAGLAVITSDAPGPTEVVDESNGIVVPAGDAEALACAMERLCEPGEAKALKAGARRVGFVTAGEQCAQTLKVYEECRAGVAASGRSWRATTIIVASGTSGEAGYDAARCLGQAGVKSQWRLAAEPLIEGCLAVTDILALDGDIPDGRVRELREACDRSGTRILGLAEACEAAGIELPAAEGGPGHGGGLRARVRQWETRARLESARVRQRVRTLGGERLRGRLASAVRRAGAPRLVLVDGTEGTGLPYRTEWAAEALRSAGFEARTIGASFAGAAQELGEAETILVHGLPGTSPLWDGIDAARAAGARVVVDVDSARVLGSLATVAGQCDGLLAPTRSLAHAARGACRLPVAVADDALGLSALVAVRHLATLKRPEGPARIGIFLDREAGASGWAALGDAPVRLAAAYPDLEFWHDGCLDEAPMPPSVLPRLRRAETGDADARLPAIRSVDVLLAPVRAGDAAHAGLPLRAWREAALAGRPLVATGTEAGVGLFEDGRNVLVAAEENDWVHRIAQLLESVAMRDAIGRNARESLVAASGLRAQGTRWRLALGQV